MKKTASGYDSRFAHKLNMLEPGIKMLKWVGILLVVGVLLLVLGWKTAAYCALGLAGAVFAVLVVLLMVEARQDRVLNEIAEREANRGDCTAGER